MRERAISAAILVPVLLIVIGIGGPVLALAVTLVTAIAAVEVFRLLHGDLFVSQLLDQIQHALAGLQQLIDAVGQLVGFLNDFVVG